MKFLFHCILILALFYFFSCNRTNRNTHYITDRGLVWNTQYNITRTGPPSLSDSIRKILDEVGHNLSVFDSLSLVSRVNRNDSTIVNSDFIRVYEMSKKINSVSDGMFDPTLSPLISAWGFGPGHKASADTLRLDSLLGLVGINKTKLEDNLLIKESAGIQFNFSAIAKGYGCDRIGEMLKRNGVSDYLVEIGGEIAASGKNPQGGKWRISVDKPVFNDTAIIHESQLIVAFSDMGMATSGNYRNYHSIGSRRYGHTISPVTGRPALTDILSATVIAPTAMEADALSTALMALGRKKAEQLCTKLKLPALIVTADTVWCSPQFSSLIIQ